jgi:hypothetical protein
MLDIPNNPAGRLLQLLQHFATGSNSMTLSQWWQHVTPKVTRRGADSYSIRAEAGALFHETEIAVRCLPPEDDREALLSTRTEWARPIFGWGLNDGNGAPYAPGDLISPNALNFLKTISSILRREAPEFEVRVSNEILDEYLDKIYAQLSELLAEVTQAKDIDSRFRARCSRKIIEAMEDVDFVSFRGLSRLDTSVRTIENQLEDAESRSQNADNPGALAKIQKMLGTVREIIIDVEKIVYPAAIAVTVAISTQDPVLAITSGITTRKFLESKIESKEVIKAMSERLQITKGSGGENNGESYENEQG